MFAREYQALLGNLLALYPQVQIHCGTLLLGAIAGTTNSMACFVQRLVPYNEAIRAAVQATGCHLVDLAATGARYTALDAFHPTGEGMRQLAQLWLGAMDGEGAKNNRLLKIFLLFFALHFGSWYNERYGTTAGKEQKVVPPQHLFVREFDRITLEG